MPGDGHSTHEKNGRKRAVFVRPKMPCAQSDDAELIWRIAVKILTSVLTAVLLLVAASSLSSAQNNLADPTDTACWQSLETLHNCAQVQNDRAMAQAERCTSYPEYQCEPESEQPQQVMHEARLQKQKKSKVGSAAAVQSHQTPANNSGSDAVIVNISPAN
jgi:CHAD domain-containing protein